MKLAFQIAMQFIRQKSSRKPAFTSVMSVVGVGFGVAALLVVITILTSVKSELKNILASANPNLIVYALGGISDVESVQKQVIGLVKKPMTRSALFYYNEGLITSPTRTAAVILRAIEGEKSANREDLEPILSPKGALAQLNSENAVLANAIPNAKPKVLLAKGLALKLGVKLGDDVSLVVAQYGKGGQSRKQVFEVAGILSIGLNEYDEKLAMMGYLDACYFFGKPGVATGVEVRLKNPDDALAVSEALNDEVHYGVRAWQQLDTRLFAQIERDGSIIMIIVCLITCVAAFNIIATLSLGVLDRKRQISLLRSLGATRTFVQQIFVFVGLILGTVGAAFGLVLAFVILQIFSGLELGDLRQFYWLERIPVQYDYHVVFVTFFAAIAISFVSSLVPAYTATRVSPLFGLKPGQK